MSLLVFVVDGFPVLYLQERTGLYGKSFTILKYRTMTYVPGRQPDLFDTQYQYITPLGRLLRRLSLDELPQLFNIFLGDMSFVGPRPLLPGRLKAYTPKQSQRLSVRPGLTGLAQIKSRHNITHSSRIRYDLLYVNNMSFALDLKILMYSFLRISTGK